MATKAVLEERIQQLEAQNRELEAAHAVTPKVTSKGLVAVHGIGQSPVTLSRGQWNRLFGHAAMLRDYMAEHEEELATASE